MNLHANFIFRIHSYIRSGGATRKVPSVQSQEAQRGTHKEYLRMPRIPLSAPRALALPLHEALHRRASYFECTVERPFSVAELGTLLGNALGMRDDTRRHYPSGGALFPIETYLIGSVLEGYPSGVFHYHPKAHALEFLWETPASFTMSKVVHQTNIPLAPVLMVFTSVWNRSGIKYGDLAYSHGLLEAGHMAQNILLVATALGVGARPLSGCDDRAITEFLDIDERVEQLVYSILLCPSSDTHAQEIIEGAKPLEENG